MAKPDEAHQEAIRHFTDLWRHDWSVTVGGVSKNLGLTRREVIAFVAMLDQRMLLSRIVELQEQILVRIAEFTDREPEDTEPERFG